MTDLISRDALLQQLRDGGYGEGWLFDQIRAAPVVKPQIVANISGGVLQGSSSDYRVDLYALDFDTDTFDHDATGVIIEGSEAYLSSTMTVIDPDFVREVVEAPTVFLHNHVEVCSECDGDRTVYDFEAKVSKLCTECNGTGEKSDA
jgi:hypothetical protein